MVPNETLYAKIGTLLNQSQEGTASHAKLLTKCQQCYKESNHDEFFETFTLVLQNALIVTSKNPYLDKIIDFVTKFATSLSAHQNNNANADATIIASSNNTVVASADAASQNETLSSTRIDATNVTATSQATTNNQTTLMEDDNIFLTSLLDHLIEISRANSDVVRFRCCQILGKLMGAISNDQFIDEDLYDRLSDSLLERLKDVNSRVQAQAISAIYRLQDPNDKDCRISTAFLFLMQFDPNWQVRFQALSHIAFSKQTLPDIIDRVRDPHPTVRRKALLILSEKVLIKFISVEKRLFILNYALKDEDSSVTEACCKKLLPSWLTFKENDVCKLLKALDVVEATETMTLMLDKMFQEHSAQQLYDEFAHLLNEKHVIASESLNAESAFYWSWVCAKIKSFETRKERLNEDEDTEDYLDKLVPSLTEFCEYVQQVLKNMQEDRSSSHDERKNIENIFITKQLISMFAYIDFSDPHGKKTLQKLCHDLFANHNYTFIFDEIMKIYRLVVPNLQQRINNLVELISDIRDPGSSNADTSMQRAQQTTAAVSSGDQNVSETNRNPGVEKDILDATTLEMDTAPPAAAASVENKLNPRELAMKISELKFQRLNYKDEFDKLYKAFKSDDIDINLLSELRNKINKCEEEITKLQDQLTNINKPAAPAASIAQNQSKRASTMENGAEQQVIDLEQQQVEDEIDPLACIDHCLRLAICLLQDVEIKTITPHIRSLFDNLILDNISSVDEQIRVLSVRALNLICILKIDIAQKYVPLLLEMISRDKKPVVIEAFKAMINCIMAYSLNRLVNTDDEPVQASKARKSISESDSAKSEATTRILSIMTSLLDSEDTEVYTVAVEGFCKLYMTGHILSAKLFSKLLILYYSPLTENDTQLRAILSSFLPQFAFYRSANQLCVEESFMLTIRCLINAQPDSYLAEIDLIKVSEVLFNLTNPNNLVQKRNPNQRQIQSNNICHENIYRSICYEILKDDNAFKVKTYLKLLQMADLTSADYLSLKSIYELIQDVHNHIEDKLLVKTAKKLCDNVQALLVKKPEHIKEQQEKEQAEKEAAAVTASQTQLEDQTQRPSETEESDATQSDRPYTRDYHSGDLIDPRFQKLKKKALSKEQLLKRALNNTAANRTQANETTVIQQKSILKPNETTKASSNKKKVAESSSSSSDTQSESPSPAKDTRKKQTKEVDLSTRFKTRQAKGKKTKNASDSSDDEAESDATVSRRKSLRSTSPRGASTSSTTTAATTSKATTTSKVCIKDIKIQLKRIDLSGLSQKVTLSEEAESLRVQVLRSRSDRVANESLINRSKSANIEESGDEDDKDESVSSKRTSKRCAESKLKSSRRTQSADVSHDQSSDGEPPVKKGRATNAATAATAKTRADVQIRTRSSSIRTTQQDKQQQQATKTARSSSSSSTAVRKSNRKSK